MAATSVMDLVPSLGGIEGAVLAVFGVLLVLAVLIKGVCFVMEAVRGEGLGICPRSDFGVKGGGVSDPGSKRAARKASGGKSGLC